MSRWQALHPGVYRFAGTPGSRQQRLLAAVIVSGEGAVASHRAAAALQRVPGGAWRLEISVPHGRRARRRDIHVHQARLDHSDVTVVDAIPVTTATRTLIDLASVIPADALEEALDDALRRRLTSVRRLQWRLVQLGTRGRPGSGILRGLIEAREGKANTESPLETRFLRLLRRAKLPLPVCQYEISDRGRLVARVDFSYPDVRLAIEIDGYRWHSGRSQWERDLGRRNQLTALGWSVIHVTSSDIERGAAEILGAISAALADGPTR